MTAKVTAKVSLRKAPRHPYHSISMESPVGVQGDGSSVKAEERRNCEQLFSTSLDLGAHFLFMGADSVAVSETGATANPARFRWLGHRNKILERRGTPFVPTYPACARFQLVTVAPGKYAALQTSRWELREVERDSAPSRRRQKFQH